MVLTRSQTMVEQEGCLLESAMRRFRLGAAESDFARGPLGEDGEWIVFRVCWATALINSVVKALFLDLRNRFSVYLEFPQYTIWRDGGKTKCSVDVLAERGAQKTVGWVEVRWTRGAVATAHLSWKDAWEKVDLFKKIAEEAEKWQLDPNLGGSPIRAPEWFGVLVVSPTGYSLQLDSRAGPVLEGCLHEVGRSSVNQRRGGGAEGVTSAGDGGSACGRGGNQPSQQRGSRSGVRRSGHGWDQGEEGKQARQRFRKSEDGFNADLGASARRNLNTSTVFLRTRSRTPNAA